MKNLKNLRLNNKLSQQKLADILHISQQSVYKYENNITSPDLETLMRMADFFNTSVDYLIDYTDTPHKVETVTDTMLNEEELRLVTYYRGLSSSQKQSIHVIINEYVKCKTLQMAADNNAS